MSDIAKQVIEYLERCKFLSILPHDAMVKLAHHCERVLLSQGEVLFYQGDISDYLYILYKGELILFLTKPSGKKIMIGMVNPIEPIGELGALSGEVRSLSVETLTDVELLRIPTEVFQELCNQYPEVLAKISRLIIHRSINTIRLFQQEKPVYHISIIYSLVKNIPYSAIKEKFCKYFNNHDSIFLCADEIQHHDLVVAINKSEKENKNLFILFDTWHNDIFKICRHKLSHLYVMIKEAEKNSIDNLHKEIFDNVRLILKRKLELILLHPDDMKQFGNTIKYLRLANFDFHYHVTWNNDADWHRLIRFMTGTAFVLVLGGGGSKGLVHIGVIKAVLDKGIAIDGIAGTSIGSTVAACYALTLDYNKMYVSMESLKKAGVKSLSFTNITWPMISFYSSNPVTRVLKNIIGSATIEDLRIPYFAISSNISERTEHLHKTGLLWEAIRSSAAIPAIFPPMILEGQVYYDGGILNNLPVDRMKEMIGPKHTILASSLSSQCKGPDFYNFPPVLPLSTTLLSRLGLGYKDYVYPPFIEVFLETFLLGASSHEERNCHLADILIKPNLTGFQCLKFAEKNTNTLIDIGYESTLKAIDKFIAMHPDNKLLKTD